MVNDAGSGAELVSADTETLSMTGPKGQYSQPVSTLANVRVELALLAVKLNVSCAQPMFVNE